MMTILPQNSILSRANSVTVDAEKFAALNSITDIFLREKIGEALGKLLNSYNRYVVEKQEYTLGQALDVIMQAAADIHEFTGIKTDEEYTPRHFGPEDNESVEPEQPSSDNQDQQPMSSPPVDRTKLLFNSFTRRRR